MHEFAILDCTNKTVFEDEEIAVAGLVGAVDFRHGGSGTTFVAVADGTVWIDGPFGEYRLDAGMYACAPQCGLILGRACRVLAVTVKQYRGMFAIGGPLEPKGRLKYIDGCTDTGLIQPPRRGDPCLNGLFFPPGIHQTRHWHPSHRVGLVYDGRGLCHIDDAKTVPMRPGDLFIIPKGAWHSFETAQSGMRIVAFHPDSDFGPTDESHQMLDATLTRSQAEAA